MTLKLENFEPLLAWLDAGCPHTGFNIHFGIVPPEEMEEDVTFHSIDNDCGSVCCIAGYVCQHLGFDAPWHEIESTAAAHLGLTPDHPYGHFRYDLFDPHLAPDDCTPAQAAEAVRRVMKGEPAWN